MRAAVLVLALFGVHLSTAQELRFQHLTTDDGLSDNAITCVYEDKAGYIWVGTEAGLDRFDGRTVMPVEGVLDHVTAIMEDRQGTVWVATRGSGLRELTNDGTLIRTYRKNTDGKPYIGSDLLTALFDLNDTTVLIGSSEASLLFLDKRSHRCTFWTDSTSIDPRNASTRPSMPSGWCHGFTSLSDGTLWISMLNKHESFVADQRTGKIIQVIGHARAGNETMVAAAEVKGSIYASGWQQGVDQFEKGQAGQGWAHLSYLPLEDEGLALAAWGESLLVVATRSLGLRIFDTDTGRSWRCTHDRNDASSLPSDRTRALLVDRSGTLWVGTANGLAKHVPSVWAMDEHVLTADNDAQELLFHRLTEDDDGALRAFTSNGFYVLGKNGSVAHAPVLHNGTELQPTIIGPDGQGGELLGTEYGLLHWDPRTQRATHPFEPHFTSEHRFALGSMFQVRKVIADTLDGVPVLQIAALGYHAISVEARSGSILGYPAPQGLARNNLFSLVHDAVRDNAGRYWYASSAGLYYWDRSTPLVHLWDEAGGSTEWNTLLEGMDVRQLMLVGDTLWGLLHEGALIRHLTDRMERFAPPPHMARRILGFARDRQGCFWITTSDGLLRFDPRNAQWLAVPVNDGTRYRKLSKAITALRDGRIAFCAANNIITFEPNAFDHLPPTPSIRMISASAGDKPIPIRDGRATLPYSSPLIDIGVSALAHGSPQPLTFLYRLEGVEDEWRTLPKGERIRYVGVPVGEHRLLVSSRDSYGRESNVQVLLTIAVSAPFWLRWWFYALIAVAVSGGVLAWYRYRLAQAMKLQAVRNRIASDLHDEVGSSLSSITIGSQLASNLSSDNNPQVREIMARIGETSSQSLRSMSDIVWAIDPKNDQGEALVKRMRRIAQELLEGKGIDVSFSVSGGVEELRLPMNARKEIVLIYKEAVHNASKYSEASLVQVSLHRRNGTLAMSVKDDGKGFDPVLHPDGHGLDSMKRRAEQLGTDLILRSAPSFGTFVGVEVDLPRIRD